MKEQDTLQFLAGWATHACVEGNLHQLQALDLPHLSVRPSSERENTHNALVLGDPLRKALLGRIVDPATFARRPCGLLLPARCHGDGCHAK